VTLAAARNLDSSHLIVGRVRAPRSAPPARSPSLLRAASEASPRALLRRQIASGMKALRRIAPAAPASVSACLAVPISPRPAEGAREPDSDEADG
jgi:hypothetical protein